MFGQMTWTMNRALAASALALGALAMAGNPFGGHSVSLNTRELAAIVESDVDRVQPTDLADRIIRGASDYRLIDVRDAAAFAQYHIPTAELVPLTALAEAPLARNESIIVYSDDTARGAQAWMLLRAQGFRGVVMLHGGLEAWKNDVVFPTAPADPTPTTQAAFDRALRVAQFFGGRGRAASGGDSGVPLMIAAPATPTAATAGPASAKGGPAPAKKKKEGC